MGGRAGRNSTSGKDAAEGEQLRHSADRAKLLAGRCLQGGCSTAASINLWGTCASGAQACRAVGRGPAALESCSQTTKARAGASHLSRSASVCSPACAKCFYLLSLCLRGWLSPSPRNANAERAAAALRSPWHAISSGPSPRPRWIRRERVTPTLQPCPDPRPAPGTRPAPWGSAKIVIQRDPVRAEPLLAAQRRCSRTAASPGLLERGISAPRQGELMVLQLHPTSAVLCVLLRRLRLSGSPDWEVSGQNERGRNRK